MLTRREFLQVMQGLSLAGLASSCTSGKKPVKITQVEPEQIYQNQETSADVRLIHFTDVHAQLLPNYFREPENSHPYLARNGQLQWQPGASLLEQFSIGGGSGLAHTICASQFEELALRYGKTGGFSHIHRLVQQLREQAGAANCVLLDGGDSWQGSATALWTKGQDMVGASNLLGVDYMTGHWEFTFGDKQVNDNLSDFNGKFLAQNIFFKEESSFDQPVREPDEEGRVFTPWQLREVGGNPIAFIGQAFPYTPIASPGNFTPQWSFAIYHRELHKIVKKIRQQHPYAAVVLLSHNGLALDLQLAERVIGIDLILGGHTHDPVVGAIEVENPAGITRVTNAGCAGKFLNVCDMKFGRRGLRSIEARLLPVLSDYLPPMPQMQDYIQDVRKKYERTLIRTVGKLPFTLYRRGNFNGSVDELILRALADFHDAEICFSPGFRWGSTVPADTDISVEDIYSWTAITYPESYRREMTGLQIRNYLEDVADNMFNSNAFLQQGGDMVRTLGLYYRLSPRAIRGSRISNLRLANGQPLQANHRYVVAGWADARTSRELKGRDMTSILQTWLSEKSSSIDRDEMRPYRPAIT